jgi:hypothetical protein
MKTIEKRTRRTKDEMKNSKNSTRKEVKLTSCYNTVIGDKRENIRKKENVIIKDVKCFLDKNIYYIAYTVNNGKVDYECRAEDLKHI